MTHAFLGIDPGKGGGIAALSESGEVVLAVRMPETEQDLLSTFASGAVHSAAAFAYIERVHASPQMGVTSAFTFGYGLGRLHMALAAAGIPFDQVTPQAWQVALNCRVKSPGMGKGDKNVTKARAQQLFPSVTVTHALADALLLAEFCRRVRTGQLPPPAPARPKQRKAKSKEALF